jgi:hypothetical protein
VSAGTGATINLEWEAPADEGGSDVSGYKVQRYNSDTGMWDEIGAPTDAGTTADPYEDSGLTLGTTYYYRVAAVNDQGTGPYTAYEGAAPTAATAPNPPVNLTATALGPDTIRLTWEEPGSNGAAITGYMLEIWEFADPEANTAADWGTAIDITGAGTTMYVHTDLEPNTRYDYRLATDGTTDSDTVQTYATTHFGAPDRPADFTVTADGDDTLVLKWTAPADNGSAITHYEIWMWDRTSKKWGWNGVAGAVQSVPHPVTTYRHGGLTPETQNIYRVRAVNEADDNNGVGLWSTIMHGTTDAADE